MLTNVNVATYNFITQYISILLYFCDPCKLYPRHVPQPSCIADKTLPKFTIIFYTLSSQPPMSKRCFTKLDTYDTVCTCDFAYTSHLTCYGNGLLPLHTAHNIFQNHPSFYSAFIKKSQTQGVTALL